MGMEAAGTEWLEGVCRAVGDDGDKVGMEKETQQNRMVWVQTA